MFHCVTENLITFQSSGLEFVSQQTFVSYKPIWSPMGLIISENYENQIGLVKIRQN